jgi:hypothetical protein
MSSNSLQTVFWIRLFPAQVNAATKRQPSDPNITAAEIEVPPRADSKYPRAIEATPETFGISPAFTATDDPAAD